MYYFYILECSDSSKYYGHTNNIKNRLKDHLRGKVSSTRNKRPVRIVYYEEFNLRPEAFRREMQFKNGKTRKKTINNLINNFLKQNVKGLIRANNLCSLSLHKLCAH